MKWSLQVYTLNAVRDECTNLYKEDKEVTNKKDGVVVVEGWAGKVKGINLLKIC